MNRYFLAIKDKKAVVMPAKDEDDAFRVCGQALGIKTDQITDTGNIDLDLCEEIQLGVPVSIDDAC